MKKANGRPTKMTLLVVGKLEEAFSFGCTDNEACAYAGINKSTLYDYCKKNEEFSSRKELLKDMPTFKAKRIVDNSLNDDDLNTAHKVIDRKEGSKVKIDSDVNLKADMTWTIEVVD